jgi:hypothetical protein
VDSAIIRFEIRNVGSTDTALPLGQALANGRKYLINELNLRMKPANGNGTDYHYWPRDYPVAIGGRLDQWFEALPVGASYRMSARAEDFFAFGRQARLSIGNSAVASMDDVCGDTEISVPSRLLDGNADIELLHCALTRAHRARERTSRIGVVLEWTRPVPGEVPAGSGSGKAA